MTTPGASQSSEATPASQPRSYRPAFVPGLNGSILLFIAVFWFFLAIRVQEVDIYQTPGWWLAQVEAFPMLSFIPPAFVTYVSELFSWRVLRHVLIPALLGWWLAGQAATGFVRSFYNFSSRAEAANFLSRLKRHAQSRPRRTPAPAAPRSAGRTRVLPVYKLLVILTPMTLTFTLLLFVSPFFPATPTRTIVYNALIIISGAVTLLAVAYFALDYFGSPPSSVGGLLLHHETLGRMRREHALLRVGGPGKIIVPGHEVAITEYNAHFCRVLGPGVQTLLPFEYVRSMIDLRPQEREGQVTGITLDGIEVACEIAVTFRLSYSDDVLDGEVSESVQPTDDRPYPYGERSARIAAYIETVDGEGGVSSWTSLPLIVAIGQFRSALTKAPLHKLYDPRAEGSPLHPDLWKEIRKKAREELHKSGITLINLRLGPLQPPADVMEQNLNGWRAYWESHLHRLRVREEVDAVYTVEDARTHAAVDMLRTIMHSISHARRESSTEITQEIMALRLLEAMEQAAHKAKEVSGEQDVEVLRQIEAIRRDLLPPGGTA